MTVKRATGRVLRSFVCEHGYLEASEADMYEAPSLCPVKITTLICHNTHDTNTNVVKLYLQTADGASSPFTERSLGPKKRLERKVGPLELNEGDKLRGEATNASEVAWTISGVKEYGNTS